jgi:hypothetical protein
MEPITVQIASVIGNIRFMEKRKKIRRLVLGVAEFR